MTATWSARINASSGSCVTKTVAPANSPRCLRRSPRTLIRVPASSAASGSSRSNTSGVVASALASATRCAWPPDNCAGRWPAWSSSPTRASHPFAISRAAGLIQALRAQAEGHVVAGGHRRKQQVVLEHDTDRALLCREPDAGGVVLPGPLANAHMTARGRQQSGDDPQRGRLPGAVWTQQRKHRATGNVDVRVEPPLRSLDDDVRVRVGHARSQRSRSPARIATETTSSTRLSAMAASGLSCSAR